MMKFWILALGPCFTYLGYLYIRNRYTPKNFKYITLLFVIGIFSPIATIFAAETLANFILSTTTGTWRMILFSYAVIGLAEEGVKFFVLLPFCMGLKDHTIGFIIALATAYSLGFATIENVIYIIFGDQLTALITGVYRMFFTIPAHVIFGALMGCGLSYARLSQKFSQKILFILLAFLLPIVMHGTFDLLIDLQKNAASYLLVALVGLIITNSCKKVGKIS